MPAKSLELQHTIRLIRELDAEIEDIETAIQAIVDEMQSPITTIPGMGVRMGAVILAEIGDFSRFDSPDKILAYAGMSPSTYQSGQLSLSGAYSHMENEVPVTCATLFTMPPNTSVIGTRTLPLTLLRNGPREALQRCALSCGKEIGSSDFCNERNLSGHTCACSITRSLISSSRRPKGRQLCYTPF